MKLYFHAGACSLADRIALLEAGRPFDTESVDLQSKRTETGADYNAINPKGYVPALLLDNGELLTENLAVLDYIAAESPALGVEGPLGRTRLLEALAYISTEVHKRFHPFFAGDSMWPAKASAAFDITSRLQLLADRMRGDYLFGDRPGVADFYLFVTLLWARKFEIEVPARLAALRDRLQARAAVQAALKAEGQPYPV